MVFNYIPLRKISKILWKPNSRQEHTPTSLSECLEQPTRRETWRIWLIILLFVPCVYYLKDLLLFERYDFWNRSFRHNNVPLEPATTKLAFTESTTVMYIKSYKTEETTQHPPGNLPICVVEKSKLGTFFIRSPPNNKFLDSRLASLSKGGYYSPANCHSRHRIAILVPYRNREKNLAMFLFNIHPFLMKQKLEYRIFVVEQKGTVAFNKGRLFNAGFEELKKYGPWHCIVFHDVDLLPLDERILYSCPSWPRHMCATVVEKLDDPIYHSLFGGVTSMTPAQYEKVNGYSNLYWGWGGEDDDMFWRLRFAQLSVTRYNKTIARYTSLRHPEASPNKLRYKILRGGLGRYRQEGLSTLEYKLVSVTERHLYTHIIVDVNPAREINSK